MWTWLACLWNIWQQGIKWGRVEGDIKVDLGEEVCFNDFPKKARQGKNTHDVCQIGKSHKGGKVNVGEE